MESDQELIERYIDGDAAALEALVRRYTKQIYIFVSRLVGSSSDAEDVTQIAFVNIWKNLEKFDTKRSFKTWAYAIARNASIDHLRKRKVLKFSDIDRGRSEDAEPFEQEIPSSEISAEERLIKVESEEHLRQALDVLNEDERAVVSLHTEEGCTFEEIGEVLGKPANTVKSQYRRALLKLKKELAPKGDKDTYL
jgi:RNA polymerase sigma-70 factor (ECF subfamily)